MAQATFTMKYRTNYTVGGTFYPTRLEVRRVGNSVILDLERSERGQARWARLRLPAGIAASLPGLIDVVTRGDVDTVAIDI